jgi:hypothetical protein
MNTHTLDEARAAKGRAREVFAPLAKVVGVGITQRDGGFAVQVNLAEPPAPGVELPRTVDDVPVAVVVVGEARKR